MSVKEVVTEDTWFIARNASYSVIHYGWVLKGEELDSGQPFIDEFDNKDAWLVRLDILGIIPEPPTGPNE